MTPNEFRAAMSDLCDRLSPTFLVGFLAAKLALICTPEQLLAIVTELKR